MAKIYVPQNSQDYHGNKEYTAILAVEISKGEGTCKGCAFFDGTNDCVSPFACNSDERPDNQDVIYVVTGERDGRK